MPPLSSDGWKADVPVLRDTIVQMIRNRGKLKEISQRVALLAEDRREEAAAVRLEALFTRLIKAKAGK